MATFTLGTHAPVEFGTWNIDDLFEYDNVSVTDTLIKFFDDDDNYIELTGSGFTADPDGYPVSGDITGVVVVEDDRVTLTMADITIDVPTIVGFVNANDADGLMQSVLGGADSLSGSQYGDELWGYAGDDTLAGDAGDDTLKGDDGADSLDGGAGDDTLEGGAGDDTLSGDGAVPGEAAGLLGKGAPIPLNIDLFDVAGGDGGFKLGGEAEFDNAGTSVAGVGDINGDGYDDVLIGTPANDEGASNGGAGYVVFGSADIPAASVDLSNLGSKGIKLIGGTAGEGAGISVSGAGDVNNDGIDDLLIGAPASGNGSAYLVFGKDTPFAATIDLDSLGTDGVKITGESPGDAMGSSVASLGDVNGDGIDDIAVSSSQKEVDGEAQVGVTYVILGKDTPFSSTLDIGALGAGGYKIVGTGLKDESGYSISGAGDVNGDGLNDLIIGALDRGELKPGFASVVFGSDTPGDVDLDALGAGGIQINGAVGFDWTGRSVSGVGDVNGDGYDDVLVGAPFHGNGGAAYLIYGSDTPAASIDLATPGSDVVKFTPENDFDDVGWSVTGIGDINQDGFADLMIGADGDMAGGDRAGSAYVVLGSDSLAATIDLGNIDSFGFEIFGEENGDATGTSVSAAGDVNGDGIGDLLIGARWNGEAANEAGAAYVVYGDLWGRSFAGHDLLDGGAGADAMAGGVGDDRYVVDNVGDTVNEDADAGTDTVEASIGYTLGENVEALVLSGGADIDGTGNDGDNIVIGNAGDNILTGGAGNDTLEGAGGNDTLDGGDGIDFVSFASSTSAVKVNLATGTASGGKIGADTLTGFENVLGGQSSDKLYGDDNGNILDGGQGKDSLYGGLGDDTYSVHHKSDKAIEKAGEGTDTVVVAEPLSTTPKYNTYTLSKYVENLTLMDGAGDAGAKGNTDANVLTGNDGANKLDGYKGNDTLEGGDGDDTLLGSYDDDSLVGGDGNDSLDGGSGMDTMAGGDGDDTYVVDNAADVVTENEDEGTDTVLSSVDHTLSDHVEELVLTGKSGIDGTGNDSDNTLTGNTGSNRLDGGLGDDTLTGGKGNDTFTVEAGSGTDVDTITDFTPGQDVIDLGSYGIDIGDWQTLEPMIADNGGNVEISMPGGDKLILVGIQKADLDSDDFAGVVSGEYWQGTSGDDTHGGTADDDMLMGMDGEDTLAAGSGDDEIMAGGGDDRVIGGDGAGNDTYHGGDGEDTLVFTSATSAVTANLATGTASGKTIGKDNLDGFENVVGGQSNDKLYGDDGENILDGGLGKDSMAGGAGDDLYLVDNRSDKVTEKKDAGTDTIHVQSVLSTTAKYNTYTLSKYVENLTLMDGAGDAGAKGNTDANVLTGNDGANKLDGYKGNDTLEGGDGDDTLLGSYDDDSLVGGDGNDSLDGGSGMDTMAGGDGDDTYVVDNAADVVTENEDEGTDTVLSSVDHTLSDHVEELVLTGKSGIDGTGNDSDNTLTGNTGSNRLDGGLGDDTLTGGKGNDTFTVEAGSGTDVDTITDFTPGQDVIDLGSYGIDIGDWQTLEPMIADNGGNVEISMPGGDKLILVGIQKADLDSDDFAGVVSGEYWQGTSGDDTHGGTADDDMLMGMDGEDTLAAGSGDDEIMAGGGDDRVIGGDGAGNDTYHGGDGEDTLVFTSATSAVTANLATGTASGKTIGKDNLDGFENVVGGQSNDKLYGDDGENILDGGLGKDSMAGGAGDDLYLVDNKSDKVTEKKDEGTDTIHVESALGATASKNTYTLSKYVENLTLMDGAGDAGAKGNGDANVLTGNAGANKLDGYKGEDTLQGGDGDDTLLGGDGDDSLDGGAGNDSLDGGAGDDTMAGGEGDDTYVVNSVADVVTENEDEGADTVLSSVDFDLSVSGAHVENLTLTGAAIEGSGDGETNVLIANAKNNVLNGGLGDDTIDGGSGNDTLMGGLGDDSLEGGKGADVASYADAGGAVTVDLSVVGAQNTGAGGTDILGGIEGVIGGDFDDTLTGNNGANTLEGGAGNDTLDGGLGNDKMFGGAGDDLFKVNSSKDRIYEEDGEGVDSVESSASHTLSANVENLTLTGVGNVKGTGNNEDNAIIGNDGKNSLFGGHGDDTLTGGLGNDTLNGSYGDDILDGGLGKDSLIGGKGSDKFVFDSLDDSGVGKSLRDSISGFKTSEGDQIDLHLIDIDFAYIGDDAFNGVAGELRFDSGVVQVDADGDGFADMEIAVSGVSTLAEDDFILS